MASRRKKPAAQLVNTKFQKNQFAAVTHYVKITDVASDKITVEDVNIKGMVFDIKGKELLDNAKSAHHFNKTEKVTMTQCAELLTHSYNVPFTVNFDKADGSNRTLVGRLLEPETLLGRSKVVDFEDLTVPFKQVDHRTLKWMVVNGIKYEVK